MRIVIRISLALLPLLFVACNLSDPEPRVEPVYQLAGGCYAIADQEGRYLRASGTSYGFSASGIGAAASLRLRTSDLGHYVFYDKDGHYLAAKRREGESSDEWVRLRTKSDESVRIAPFEVFSDAEWAIVKPKDKSATYLIRHLNSGRYLGRHGLGNYEQAAHVRFTEREGCLEYPELSLDARGTVRREPWPDGDVYGVADSHSHLFTNLGFGGGGVFHGSPFHRLGVEHALGDCEEFHGPGGSRDIIGFFYGGSQELEPEKLPRILVDGTTGEFNHATDGYPTFSAWPDPRNIPTHQAQYYRWIERAYMGGLRLIFQHATGNSALCELMVAVDAQEAPYGCNDMDSVDLQIDATYALERYIDALSGGPGLGWFRVVTSPDQAREEINKGNLAVVLGIEISNVFDCFLTPPSGKNPCTVEHVKEQVKKYYEKGVRTVFPVHKFDNGFSAGDGHRGAIELGNYINSGHYSSYTLDCPDIKTTFDKGNVVFGGLNEPRDEYFSRAPNDISRLTEDPLVTLLPLTTKLVAGELKGDYCQSHGLTDLGRVLLDELMAYGMIIDVAHLPQWSVKEALEILDRKKHPAISTHSSRFDGKIYRHGGTANAGLGRCGDPDTPGQMASSYLEKAAEIQAANGLPALPLGFDLNGFAGAPSPRFGEYACDTTQANPVTYPFKSYDGGVTFEQPMLGERVLDFNENGMVHIGLLPEYIEDVRRDGTSDEDLEPLFRTAETLIRVWEASEASRLSD